VVVRTRVLILAGGALLAACTIQTIYPYGSGPQDGTAYEVVGAGGGIVTTSDGTTLLIPPMALTTDVTITIGLDPTPPLITQARAVTSGHVFGPQGQTFLLPVCITLSFEPEQLPAGTTEANVVLYETPPDGGVYEALPTIPASPTQVTGMTTVLSEVIGAYGSTLELDAGADADECDGSDIDAGEAGM
jgi:hypothetical protein